MLAGKCKGHGEAIGTRLHRFETDITGVRLSCGCHLAMVGLIIFVQLHILSEASDALYWTVQVDASRPVDVDDRKVR